MKNVVQVRDKDQKELSLYLEDEHLGEFISSLLGQPQAISKSFNKPFKVDHSFFKHLLALIFQRLEQQNEFEMVDFVAKISFDDGVERKITSVESFNSYSETMSLISVRLFISISLLIKFPSKKIPERQNINFVFDSNMDCNNNTILESSNKKTGIVIIDIEHTERTWADDMLTMIEKALDGIWIEENFIFKSIMKIIDLLSSKGFLLFSMLLSIIMLFYSTYTKSSNDVIEELEKLSIQNSNNLELINEKLNFISKILLDRSDYSGTNLLLFSVSIPFLVILISILKEFIKPYPSYVVLTKSTQDLMSKSLSNTSTKNKFFSTSIMLVMSLVIGILGNYIYNSFINVV
ncbi:hypothetical protein [Psychrobacter sp. UBA3480]|uniref:hypothetical protein n=1 Tax=Psychrobacter sp. UBA3480 TaxID=1947350 RepID=UPI0025D5E284|nr:hypothetical protein [Psychrobacter sp. UBA3480]